MSVQKLDGFTADGFGNVIGGPNDLNPGDVQRITSPNGSVTECRYCPLPAPPVPPEFKTLTGDKFMALIAGVLGIDRTDQLIAKSKTVEALLLRASFVNRATGNLPTALNKLMQGANALTQAELDQIDAAWRAL